MRRRKKPDLHEASGLFSRTLSNLAFLPPSHISAFTTYVRALAPSQTSPHATFFTTFLTLYNNVESVLRALARPPQTISRIHAVRREAERSYSSVSRSSRWPLGLSLLDDTRQRMNEEREEKARRSEGEAERLSRELRYAQQTVAGELAGWRDMHERMGRRAIRELARGMVICERIRLDGMQRALRIVREGQAQGQGEGKVVGEGGRAESGVKRRAGGGSPLVHSISVEGNGETAEVGEASGSW
jgi:hypothetical protein